jgi:hypothetical protein
MLVSSSRMITKHTVSLDPRDVKRALIEYIARNPTGDQRELAYDAERMFKEGGSAPFTITEYEEDSRYGPEGSVDVITVVEFSTTPHPVPPTPKPSPDTTGDTPQDPGSVDDDLPF